MSTMILNDEHHLFVAAIAAYYGEIDESEIIPWAGLLKNENIIAYNTDYPDDEVKLSAMVRVSLKLAGQYIQLVRVAGISQCLSIVECYEYQACSSRRWQFHDQFEGRVLPSMTKMLVDSLLANIKGEMKCSDIPHNPDNRNKWGVDGQFVSTLSEKLGGAA